MEDELDKEIIEVLNTPLEDIESQIPISEQQSPLNQQVKTGDIAAPSFDATTDSNGSFRKQAETQHAFDKAQQERSDAPEQQIEGDFKEQTGGDPMEIPDQAIPNAQSLQTAEALLGMADNVIAVGAGYFIKVKKHQEFYEYDEIVQIIDDQNEKNVKRVCLDEDDKALLKPLLAIVLQNKAKQLTPEQQLLGAATAIIIKKIQIVLEMRSENRSLEDRLLQIIADSKKEDTPHQNTKTRARTTTAKAPMFTAEDESSLDAMEEDTDMPSGAEFSDQNNGMDVVYEEVAAAPVKTPTTIKPAKNVAKTTRSTLKKTSSNTKHPLPSDTNDQLESPEDTS